jgi:hypothetical protein
VTQLHRPGDAREATVASPSRSAITIDGDRFSITAARGAGQHPARTPRGSPSHDGALGGILRPASGLRRPPPSACTTPSRSASASQTALSDQLFREWKNPSKSIGGIVD